MSGARAALPAAPLPSSAAQPACGRDFNLQSQIPVITTEPVRVWPIGSIAQRQGTASQTARRPAPAVRTCTPEAAWLSSRRQPHRRPLAAIVLSIRSSGCQSPSAGRGDSAQRMSNINRGTNGVGAELGCENQTSPINHVTFVQAKSAAACAPSTSLRAGFKP